MNYDQLQPKSLNGYENGSLPDIGTKINTPQIGQYSKLNEPSFLNQNYRKKGMLENPDKYQGMNVASSNFDNYQRQVPYGKHSGLGVQNDQPIQYPSDNKNLKDAQLNNYSIEGVEQLKYFDKLNKAAER
jgi:hypothetical protein